QYMTGEAVQSSYILAHEGCSRLAGGLRQKMVFYRNALQTGSIFGTSALTRAHPFFSSFDGRIYLPDGRSLRMVTGPDWDRVEVGVFVRSFSFALTAEQFSERV